MQLEIRFESVQAQGMRKVVISTIPQLNYNIFLSVYEESLKTSFFQENIFFKC